MPYCNVTACEVGPAEQVHYSVEAGQFAAGLFLSLHHSIGLHAEHVVYWGHHAQTLRKPGTIQEQVKNTQTNCYVLPSHLFVLTVLNHLIRQTSIKHVFKSIKMFIRYQ